MMDIKSCDKLYWCWYEGKHSNYKGGGTFFSESKSFGYNLLFWKEYFLGKKMQS